MRQETDANYLHREVHERGRVQDCAPINHPWYICCREKDSRRQGLRVRGKRSRESRIYLAMYTSEEFYDETFEFTYGESDYLWKGDYRIESFDEDGDYDTPPTGETKVKLIHTTELLKTNDEGEYEHILLDHDLKYFITEYIRETL
jgi:hypothetical protein